MDARSEGTSTHLDGLRLSSSLPHQPWFQVSDSHAPGPLARTISPQVRFRLGESALDESALARRTTALRQLHGNPRPLSRKQRESKSVNNRHSSLASQPVLVRSYSDETEEAQSSSTMPSAQPRVPELPSVQDFSIEGILRAIEPDIRSTLDSIAEICGRSKLSLANEYGSHIAPFGEIETPPGGLLTVEEASASSERLADDNVVIVDDDNSFLDGRDYYNPSTYSLLENLRQAAYATGYQRSVRTPHDGSSSVQAQPDTPRTPTATNPISDNDPNSRSPSMTKQFTIKPNPGSRALLGNTAHPGANGDSPEIVTPALLSEIHLDARANGSSWPSVPPDTPRVSSAFVASKFPKKGGIPVQPSRADKFSLVADVHGWLAWLKAIVQRENPERIVTYRPPFSAETTLRAVLERHPANTIRPQEQGVAVMTG